MSRLRLLGWVALGVLVIFLLTAPLFLKTYGVYILALWAVTSIAAMGLNLTLGYGGQISLSQGAFVGIGAYTTALLIGRGVPYEVAFLASGLLSFIIGWCLGYPALRVQHHFLAFVTLSFSTLVFLILRNEEWLTNGIYGIDNIKRPVVFGFSTASGTHYYYFAMLMMAIFALINGWIIRSPWGRAFVALRENPLRASSLGINVRQYTLMAFAIGSTFAGFAGALFAPLVQFIDPNSFQLTYSMKYLLMVIVGGPGYFVGPFLGAMIDMLLPEWLRITQNYYLLIYAIMVMVLMNVAPKGIIGWVDQRLNRPPSKPSTPIPPREPPVISEVHDVTHP